MNDRQVLVDVLNADLRDEHASAIRYLIHAYQVGKDTELDAMLLSMAREEMWHIDWLADEIGEMVTAFGCWRPWCCASARSDLRPRVRRQT